jgi:hypothetical protein
MLLSAVCLFSFYDAFCFILNSVIGVWASPVTLFYSSISI